MVDQPAPSAPNPVPGPPAMPLVPGAPTVALPQGVQVANPWLRFGSYLLEGLLVTITLGIGWLIWAAMIAGTGQTPAKRLLKLRVIGADSMRPVGFAKMFFVRGIVGGWVASIAIMFTLGVLAFMPFWDRRHQNIWDKVSNTYVVVDPNDAWGTKPNLR